jgi:hypothetical protein
MYEGKLYSGTLPDWSAFPQQSRVGNVTDVLFAYGIGLAGAEGRAQLPATLPILSDKEMHDLRDAGKGQIVRIYSPKLCYDVDAPLREHDDRRLGAASFAPLASVSGLGKSYRGSPSHLDHDLRLALEGIREELGREPLASGVGMPRLCWNRDRLPLFEVELYVNVLLKPAPESE